MADAGAIILAHTEAALLLNYYMESPQLNTLYTPIPLLFLFPFTFAHTHSKWRRSSSKYQPIHRSLQADFYSDFPVHEHASDLLLEIAIANNTVRGKIRLA
jgi:hypothetical protein